MLDSTTSSTREEVESVTHESETEKASGRPERRRARQARDLVEHVLEPVRLGRDLHRAQRGARQLLASAARAVERECEREGRGRTSSNPAARHSFCCASRALPVTAQTGCERAGGPTSQ